MRARRHTASREVFFHQTPEPTKQSYASTKSNFPQISPQFQKTMIRNNANTGDLHSMEAPMWAINLMTEQIIYANVRLKSKLIKT